MRLERLLKPDSIAVYGASENRGPGRRILEMLDKMGYGGAVYPINPKYETVLGKRCYRGLEEIPEGIDAIVFCVNHRLVTEPFQLAAARGYGGAVVLDSGFAELGEEGRRRQEELEDRGARRRHGRMRPNCMGVLSPHHRISLYTSNLLHPEKLLGNVAIVTQSGSIAIGLLTDCRRFGFSHVVSTGNEAVTTTADFIEHSGRRPPHPGDRHLHRDHPRSGTLRRRPGQGRGPRQAGGGAQGRAQRPDAPGHHQPHRRARRRSPGLYRGPQAAPGHRGQRHGRADRGAGVLPGRALAHRTETRPDYRIRGAGGADPGRGRRRRAVPAALVRGRPPGGKTRHRFDNRRRQPPRCLGRRPVRREHAPRTEGAGGRARRGLHRHGQRQPRRLADGPHPVHAVSGRGRPTNHQAVLLHEHPAGPLPAGVRRRATLGGGPHHRRDAPGSGRH